MTKDEIEIEEKLARKFSEYLKEELGESDFQKMVHDSIEENTKEKWYCLSHDYVDANITMDRAFKEVVGRDFVFFDDEQPETEKQHEYDNSLINAAWSMAKRNDFYIKDL